MSDVSDGDVNETSETQDTIEDEGDLESNYKTPNEDDADADDSSKPETPQREIGPEKHHGPKTNDDDQER